MDNIDSKCTLGTNTWHGGQVSGQRTISLVLPAAPRSQSSSPAQRLQPAPVSTCQVRGSEPQAPHQTIALGRSTENEPRTMATHSAQDVVFTRWYLFHAPPLDVRRPTRAHFHETMRSWSNAADGVVRPCSTPSSLTCDLQWLFPHPLRRLTVCALFGGRLLDPAQTLKRDYAGKTAWVRMDNHSSNQARPA
ncbi:uncharacterized protein M421DRAFT_293428 [Didymella exigua CBS 183.55]|uniref:Uncharacterized protein n=1 Tax=Didymella exigua CBS 183.55 TaxID=1150837 RepID=A0A6A5RY10_9PLEO|nr:uncharacterized protein M421DRAFT_293428 [Didymella exigua CBS 183.55]KAF1932493.1 hypothetical protein M421DRAFT_293428 [Didymella exigua CBS 183.55]